MQTKDQISVLREKQLHFFASGITKNLKFRKESLRKLYKSIKGHEDDIRLALRKDLNKSSFETYATETGIVLHELRNLAGNLERWAKPKRVATPLFAHPSASLIYPEPLGMVLIISPWNYPFQLPMVPLAGAVAAGNVVTIRQSRFSPATNAVIGKILAECFTGDHVALVECDLETAEAALEMKWDMIFFTGSTQVGKKIYSAAAKNLTPVVLELGGKSPVVVEEDAVVNVAARRIMWGKMINSGQTCISPDYLFVHERIRGKLVDALKHEALKMYGNNPFINPDYPRLISEKALDRMICYMEDTRILHGGRYDRDKLMIEPTIVEATPEAECMKEEIFGPVLPVLSYSNLDEAISFINSGQKPLAAYIFTTSRDKQKRFLNETSSGACLVNDVILHIANKKLPFGGVGDSGTGRYHGKESFRAFSNLKAVMRTNPRIDIPVKYPPFGKKEKILRLFLR